MSIASEIVRIKENISNAYSSAETAGATIPSEKTIANLPSTLETLQITGGDRWGLSMDNILGKLDSNGKLSFSDITLTFDGATKIERFSDTHYRFFEHNQNVVAVNAPTVTEISANACTKMLYQSDRLESVNFPALETIGENGLKQAFDFSNNITEALFPKLKTIGDYGLQDGFTPADKMTNIDFSSLETVGEYGMNRCFSAGTATTPTKIQIVSFPKLKKIGYMGLGSCFWYGTSITAASFNALEEVDDYGLSSAFYGCTRLTTISFPKLITIGSAAFYTAFTNSGVTEIHFRSDMMANISAQSGYSEKFGATNATIYFDL